MLKIIIILISIFAFAKSSESKTDNKPEKIEVSLADSSQLIIEGKHRFVEIAGIRGLHVSSLKTKAFIKTNILNLDKGTVSFWMSPLEDFDKSAKVGMMIYPMLSDIYPPRKINDCNFSIYYQGINYPKVIARFSDGHFWGKMDFGLAPSVYAE